MAEPRLHMIWPMRLIYLALVCAVIFSSLLPLENMARRWAGPDVLLALTFVWLLRRPDYVPPLIIAGVFLLADLLFQRPPGLWAAIVLIGCETLRSRAGNLRDLTFVAEWVSVATTLVAMILCYRLALALMVVDRPPLGMTLIQMIMTLAAYPLVALLSAGLFGVRKPTPGEAELTGIRL